MSIYTALTWIMFIGLFPLSFFWLRRAWIIGIKKDYSYVAVKRGIPSGNPKKYAKYSIGINLVAGLVLITVILLIIIAGMEYKQWTAIAGSTLWMKLLAEFALSRQAHMKVKK